MYNLFENYPDAEGVMPLLFSIRDGIPFAYESILLSIFSVLLIGNYYIIKTKTGKGKFLSSFAATSFVMVVLSLFLAMSEILEYWSVLFYTLLSIISFVLIYFSDDR
jgi:hypothetical protein